MPERKIRTCYEIVTEESAAYGEAAEAGELRVEDVAPDEFDIEDYGSFLGAVVGITCEAIGSCVEPSSSHFHPGVWYTDIDGELDMYTGESERHSYHLVGFTTEEEKAIFDRKVKP